MRKVSRPYEAKERREMTAKEYLSEYRNLELKIASKERELEDLRAKLEGCSSRQMDGMPRATGNSSDPIGDAVTKIVAMQMEINEEIDKSIDLRREIGARIDKLSNETYASLLRYRYVMMMRWEKIAEAMNYGIDNVFRLHGRALQEFENTNRMNKDYRQIKNHK